MEDALISSEGLAILAGAGLIAADEANSNKGMFVHTTSQIEVEAENTITISGDFACWTGDATGSVDLSTTTPAYTDTRKLEDYQNDSADIFVMVLDEDGQVADEPCIPASVVYSVTTETKPDGTEVKTPVTTITCYSHAGTLAKGSIVLVDYYVRRTSGAQQIEITADKFAGNYYIEASGLFRRESDGVDMPAEFVIPNGKVQSNFTFTMANSGDPSTFTFTVDAFPGYTKFDRTHKVLAAIQVIEDSEGSEDEKREVCTPGTSGE